MFNQRRFFFLAILISFPILYAQAQTPNPRVKGPMLRTADHNDMPWEIYRTDGLDSTYSDTIQRTFITYTPTGMVERKTFGQLDTTTLILDWTDRWEYSYDSIDQNIETIQRVYENSSWKPAFRDTYVYDSLSNLIAHDYYTWGGSAWELQIQEAWVISLDSSGRIESIMERMANAPNFNWGDVELNEYSYNASNEWDTVTTTPFPSGIIHRAVYDSWHDFANDQPAITHVEVFFGIWLNQVQRKYTYGPNGDYEVITELWQANAWETTFKSEFFHDVQEHSILEQSFQLDTALVWQLTTENVFVNTYDASLRLLRRSAHMIEFQFSDTTDYVDHFSYGPMSAVGANASESIKVWPNPSNGAFNMELPAQLGAGSLQIVDAQGRLRLSGAIGGSLIHGLELPESWAPGTYFYSIRSEKGESFSGKLVLQR